MQTPLIGAHAISEKARADRLYLHYALALACLLTVAGVILAVLALGDRLDVIIHGDGGVKARLINAAPGFVLCLAATILFWASRPRRPLVQEAPASDDIERRIDRALATRLAIQNAALLTPARAQGRPPQTLFSHIANSLADALEQGALEALPALRKSEEPPAGRSKVNGDT